MVDTTAATEANPCKADSERRQRAHRDSALVERAGNFERRISFEVGYDHRAFPEACGGGGHGQHGMAMRFVFIGPAGAVQWLVYMTNWVPGNVQHGHVEAQAAVSIVPVNHPPVGDGMAADLGYHASEPLYEDHGRFECEYLPQGYCYYDGSGLNAEPVLEAFLSHGPHAVWAALARYYAETFHEREPYVVGGTDRGDAS